MSSINPGDIVASNGRIITRQADRRRHISFEQATVLAVNGDKITINPAGMRVTLVAQEDDLITDISADAQLDEREPAVSGTSTRPPRPTERVQNPPPPPEVVQKTKPKLSALHIASKVTDEPSAPSAPKPTPKRRATKPTARRPRK